MLEGNAKKQEYLVENQPENSIAFQCLQISKQLALSSTKLCFISSVNEITRLFQTQNQQNIDTSNKDNYNKWLFEIKQNIEHQSQLHQIHLLKSNRKLVFYSTFKYDTKCSSFLELKLRMGNHNLKIETGRHSCPKIPENLRTCDHCGSQYIENETHFLFHCILYNQIRTTLYNDMNSRYQNFRRMNTTEKVIFLFNNVDPFVCKKIAWFIIEAFVIRKDKLLL